MRSPILALSRDEAILLLRNKAVATTSIVIPILIGVLVAFAGSTGGRAWSMMLAHLVTFALAFTVYFAVTASLAARREDRSLKRLCSAAVPVPMVLAGMLLPSVLIAMAQIVVFVGFAVVGGAPTPNPLLLLVAVLGGTAMCVAAGLATSGRTASSEQAQVTTLPMLLALFAGATWGSLVETPLVLLVPGGAVGDLLRRSVTDGSLFGALPALAALVGWTVLAGYLAYRWFRFQPR